VRYSEHLHQAGIRPSVGSVGDSFDNALAETTVGLYKTEVIGHQGPWTGLRQVEAATALWVGWYNQVRLYGPLGYRPPAEYEQLYYAGLAAETPSENGGSAPAPPALLGEGALLAGPTTCGGTGERVKGACGVARDDRCALTLDPLPEPADEIESARRGETTHGPDPATVRHPRRTVDDIDPPDSTLW
jgi:hypothetical protein